MPSMDVAQLLSVSRRNAEAFTAAGQALAESSQAITRRQAELVRAQVEKSLKTAKEQLVNGSPEINTTKQVEFAKTMFESSLNNLREVCELAGKSCLEAFDITSRRHLAGHRRDDQRCHGDCCFEQKEKRVSAGGTGALLRLPTSMIKRTSEC